MQEERETRAPSIERGKVANWIIWPSVLLIICGFLMFCGGGIVYREFYNTVDATLGRLFIVGSALFGAGFLGSCGVVLYSFSFDGSPQVSWSQKTPVLMTPKELQQVVGGTGALPIATTNPHVVTAGKRRREFSQSEMNHLANRYFADGTDYRVTRDDADGKKVFSDYGFVVALMTDAGYWHKEGGGIYWTEQGGEWFKSRMRSVI